MKRIIVLVCLFSLINANRIKAYDEGSISFSDIVIQKDEVVSIDLILDSNPGIVSFRAALIFDESIEVVGVEDTGLLKEFMQAESFLGSPQIIRWMDATASENNSSLGVLLKVKFRIKDKSASSEGKIAVPVTLNYIEARNKDGDVVLFPNLTKTAIVSVYETPEPPEIEKVEATSITLCSSEGNEYSVNGGEWTTNTTFSGLTPNTEYSFRQRKATANNSLASLPSESREVRTLKKIRNYSPYAPSVKAIESRKVTLAVNNSIEYSLDGLNWQLSNEFTDLSPATDYIFYARYREIETYYASESSVGTKVTTIKDSVAAPGKPIAEKIEESSITLKEIEGAVYSLDGKTWQESNVFEGLEQGTEYTFYAKLSETQTTFESDVSEGVTITTKVLYGDANNDGKVTSLDIVRLKKHLANQSVTVGKGANVNGDAVVDSLDLARLKRYFAEYDLAEKKSSVILGPAA